MMMSGVYLPMEMAALQNTELARTRLELTQRQAIAQRDELLEQLARQDAVADAAGAPLHAAAASKPQN